jgi:5-(carboxyamino)imidazole ribonucleotide mutase
MPGGVPVATVSVAGARNAGLLAVRILGTSDEALRTRMTDFQAELGEQAKAKGEALRRKRSGGGMGFGV